MKKTIAYMLVAMLVLLIAASMVYAATPEQKAPPAGPRQHITLTDAQKQELVPLHNQILETRKQITQKYVDWGYLTQEQADERNTRMQEHMNKMQSGEWKGHGMMGKGHHSGQKPCCQQQAPAANQ